MYSSVQEIDAMCAENKRGLLPPYNRDFIRLSQYINDTPYMASNHDVLVLVLWLGSYESYSGGSSLVFCARRGHSLDAVLLSKNRRCFLFGTYLNDSDTVVVPLPCSPYSPL